MNRLAVDVALCSWGERLFNPRPRNREPLVAKWQSGVLPPTLGEDVRSTLRALICRAPEVMVRVSGGGRGMAPIKDYMSYISRRGALALEDERGEKILGWEALLDLVQEWRYARSAIPSRSYRREALNIILSMPAGTDAQALFDAAREFAQTTFAPHKFAMVLHEPQTDARSHQPHVHLIVRRQAQDGTRLRPSNADLARWRQQFADELREQGIAASATRRHMRGELQPGMRLPEDFGSRIAHESGGISPNERAAALELDVLAAWHAMASALSRSEDEEDRTLARQTLEFVRHMPMVARRRAVRDEPGRVHFHCAVGSIQRSRESEEATNAGRHRQLERTR